FRQATHQLLTWEKKASGTWKEATRRTRNPPEEKVDLFRGFDRSAMQWLNRPCIQRVHFCECLYLLRRNGRGLFQNEPGHAFGTWRRGERARKRVIRVPGRQQSGRASWMYLLRDRAVRCAWSALLPCVRIVPPGVQAYGSF